MKKIVSPKEMARIEKLAYLEGFLEETFMENAGQAIAMWLHRHLLLEKKEKKGIILLCGKGNNGGDGFTAGFYLLKMGYEVRAIAPDFDDCRGACQKNYKRYLRTGGSVFPLSLESPFSLDESVVVDGLFGTGFRGELASPYREIVAKINASNCCRISIDIPSGLNGESGEVETEAVCADFTLALGLLKQGFFLNRGWDYVGRIAVLDFGLPQTYVDLAKGSLFYYEKEDAKKNIPPLRKTRHKYQAGTTAIFAGSQGMGGAAKLAAKAALKSGAGMVYLFHPEEVKSELLNVCDEVITCSYHPSDSSSFDKVKKRIKSLLIGPGIGKCHFYPCLDQWSTPSVFDADALSLIADQSLKPPPMAILTPHLGELSRLLNICFSTMDLAIVEKTREFAHSHQLFLLVKGAVSYLFTPEQSIYVIAGGDPGMATAGSGDVLAGLIASLLAQSLGAREAVLLATYLHKLAGELAAASLSSYAMTATDIIDHFAPAFLKLAPRELFGLMDIIIGNETSGRTV